MDMRELVAECLEDLGHDVYEAESSQQALAMAQIHRLDLAVTDVRMRLRDGIETVRLLKEEQPQLRTNVITGYASDDAPSRAIQIEADDYIYKPFKLKDLTRSVNRVLKKDEERTLYQKMAETFRAGYRPFQEKATTVLLEKEMAALDSIRNRALKAFYVAVRAEMLEGDRAFVIWQRVSLTEAQREQLKRESLPLADLKELAAQYRSLSDLLAAVGRANSVTLRPRNDPDGLTEEQFQPLYENIRSGNISSEQLKLAEFLRRLEPSVLKQSEQLQQLYQQVWCSS